MLVTLAGMLMEVSEFAPLNASFPMLVTPSGMLIEDIEVPFKAVFPMLVTLAGMVIEVIGVP
jgi:hypothetical protein